MENAAQNSQNQDTKTQKTTLTLKKVYYGLWGVYGVLVGYSFWYFKESVNIHYFDGSVVPGALMVVLLTLISMIYGQLRKINNPTKKNLFTHMVAGVAVLQTIVAASLVYLDCNGQGFCGIGAAYIGFINGVSTLVVICVALSGGSVFLKLREKKI